MPALAQRRHSSVSRASCSFGVERFERGLQLLDQFRRGARGQRSRLLGGGAQIADHPLDVADAHFPGALHFRALDLCALGLYVLRLRVLGYRRPPASAPSALALSEASGAAGAAATSAAARVARSCRRARFSAAARALASRLASRAA